MRDEIASAPHVAPQIQPQPVRHPTPAASVTPTDGAADESLEERIAIAAQMTYETDPPGNIGNAFRVALHDAFRASRGAEILEFDCKSRICRAVLLFQDAIADKDAFDQIFVTHARGIDGGVGSLVVPTRETLSDGKVRTEVFVSSNGPVYDPEEI